MREVELTCAQFTPTADGYHLHFPDVRSAEAKALLAASQSSEPVSTTGQLHCTALVGLISLGGHGADFKLVRVTPQ